MPGAREIGVERQGTFNQRQYRTDVLAKIGEHVGGIDQDGRIVAGHFQGSAAELAAL